MKRERTRTVQERADPNSGNDVFWERVSHAIQKQGRVWNDFFRARQAERTGGRIVGGRWRRSIVVCGNLLRLTLVKRRMFADGAASLLPGQRGGKRDVSAASDRWFHKHFADDDQNEICVCDTSSTTVTIQSQLQSINMWSFRHPKLLRIRIIFGIDLHINNKFMWCYVVFWTILSLQCGYALCKWTTLHFWAPSSFCSLLYKLQIVPLPASTDTKSVPSLSDGGGASHRTHQTVKRGCAEDSATTLPISRLKSFQKYILVCCSALIEEVSEQQTAVILFCENRGWKNSG